MNRRLSEERIRSTCRDLMAGRGSVSGRALRQELRERFGAVGKTARVFQIWREEVHTVQPASFPTLPVDATELQHRLEAAESVGQENLKRAELAELREQAHQDRWALQIDQLRQELQTRPKYAVEIRALQDQVMRLTAELAAARSLLKS